MGNGASVNKMRRYATSRNDSKLSGSRSLTLSSISRVDVGAGVVNIKVLCIIKTYGPEAKVVARKIVTVTLQSLLDLVFEVKKKLRVILAVEDIELMCRGVPTDDKRPVAFYQLQDMFDCFVAHGFKPTYELVVAMPSGEVHTVQVQKRNNIGQLLRKVCDLGGISEVTSEGYEFEHRGRMLKRWHVLDMYGVHQEPRLIIRLKTWFINITISTFSADTFVLSGLAPTATVAMLKQIVSDEWGIPPLQQKILFKGQQLQEEQLTLADYGVHSGAALQMLRLTAADAGVNGDVMFVDPMALDGSLTRQEGANWLDPQTSQWRGARRGFCIEARCQNSGCEAQGSAVICNCGLGSFELNEEWARVECPSCHRKVDPITTAFNRCKWMYKGVRGKPTKKSGEAMAIDAVEFRDWLFVGDKFEHARELTRTSWRKLLIVTRPTGHDNDVLMKDVATFPGSPSHSLIDLPVDGQHESTNSIECLLCYERLNMEERAIGAYCKHPFHQGCWSVWMTSGGGCPSCRVPIKRTT